MNTHNLELRNIQIVDKMSEETICFTADVYDTSIGKRGKNLFSVYNDGHGGCTHIRGVSTAIKAVGITSAQDENKFIQWVDDQVTNHANNREEQKFLKKLDRTAKKMLVFCDAMPPTKYIAVGSPKVPFQQYSEATIVNTIKKYIAEGWQLYNTNVDPVITQKVFQVTQ